MPAKKAIKIKKQPLRIFLKELNVLESAKNPQAQSSEQVAQDQETKNEDIPAENQPAKVEATQSPDALKQLRNGVPIESVQGNSNLDQLIEQLAVYDKQDGEEFDASFFSKKEETEVMQTTPNTTTSADEMQPSILPPQETKTNPENSINIDGLALQIMSVDRDLEELGRLHRYVKANKLYDPRIYNALIRAAFALNKMDYVDSYYTEAASLNVANPETYRILIEIKGKQKRIYGVDMFYQHMKRNGWLDAETCLAVIEALMHCDNPNAAWNFYVNDVPPEIKSTHWKIHEAMMSMVFYYSLEYVPGRAAHNENLNNLLRMATLAYSNAISAKMDVDYDKVHFKLLQIAISYNLLELAYGIYKDAKEAKTNGPLSDQAYEACKTMINKVYGSEAQLEMSLNQSAPRSNNRLAANHSVRPMPSMTPPPAQVYYTQGAYNTAAFVQPRHVQQYRSAASSSQGHHATTRQSFNNMGQRFGNGGH